VARKPSPEKKLELESLHRVVRVLAAWIDSRPNALSGGEFSATAQRVFVVKMLLRIRAASMSISIADASTPCLCAVLPPIYRHHHLTACIESNAFGRSQRLMKKPRL